MTDFDVHETAKVRKGKPSQPGARVGRMKIIAAGLTAFGEKFPGESEASINLLWSLGSGRPESALTEGDRKANGDATHVLDFRRITGASKARRNTEGVVLVDQDAHDKAKAFLAEHDGDDKVQGSEVA